MSSETGGSEPGVGTSATDTFRAHLDHHRIPVATPGRGSSLARLGVVACVVGIALGFIAFMLSRGTTDTAAQGYALVMAVVGVALVILGSMVFLRWSLGRFLRLWFARLLHELQR